MIGNWLALSIISAKELYDVWLTFLDPLYDKKYKRHGNDSSETDARRVSRGLSSSPLRHVASGSVESPRGKSDRTSKARPVTLYRTCITPPTLQMMAHYYGVTATGRHPLPPTRA